ncbi:hypothetical protein WJX81_000337 [Elliptochloris bilobata]|uniref:Protein FAM33A n=1 Tax=Elliptochloris bilobata TaxID=381761 RepID=A0AAW1QMY7_9CHLO
MTSLPAATEHFLTSLEKAEADLKAVARRFEEEFQERCGGVAVNPLSILQRIKKLERELPQVREECCAVLEAKQALVDAAHRGLAGNHAAVVQLQGRAGLPPGDDAALRDFAGAVAEWSRVVGALGSGTSECNAPNSGSLNRALVDSVFGEA